MVSEAIQSEDAPNAFEDVFEGMKFNFKKYVVIFLLVIFILTDIFAETVLVHVGGVETVGTRVIPNTTGTIVQVLCIFAVFFIVDFISSKGVL